MLIKMDFFQYIFKIMQIIHRIATIEHILAVFLWYNYYLNHSKR
jgi:hypothetical protein